MLISFARRDWNPSDVPGDARVAGGELINVAQPLLDLIDGALSRAATRLELPSLRIDGLGTFGRERRLVRELYRPLIQSVAGLAQLVRSALGEALVQLAQVLKQIL